MFSEVASVAIARTASHNATRRTGRGSRAGAFAAAVLVFTLLMSCLIALPGCGGGSGGGGNTAAAATGGGGGSASGGSFEQPSDVRMPVVNIAGGTDIDVSTANDGYVSACGESASRLKFQVNNGDVTYNYDLPNNGTPTVYPVNMGDGSYNFRIMQNTEGSNYVELTSASASVSLASEFDPFLVPNMFCSYTPSSSCVSKARELTADAANQGEAVRNVCTFLTENISYDRAKAAELSTGTGYVPNPDETLSSKTGICFDYASLAAAMLRSMGFPTQIVTGYVGKDQIYHAWIMVYADGTWHTASFAVDPNTWSRVDVTFAASGSNEFVGDGSAYTDRYIY